MVYTSTHIYNNQYTTVPALQTGDENMTFALNFTVSYQVPAQALFTVTFPDSVSLISSPSVTITQQVASQVQNWGPKNLVVATNFTRFFPAQTWFCINITGSNRVSR